ncbi:HAMP domain-containing sensor histidine kinase [Danxiaibacter flavus]|uniref:histidine kinase n=1 Tax=Danxiaibacter flavus TaxID=3049108 RepID=A0ABV3Z9Y1_9BACT|nr:HAMP domain-containing sensor histidine kinase [Chitinophagaceae bacterium DXS]
MKKNNSVVFIIISLCCFLLLSAVQFYLVFNTYKLKNQSYYYVEKEAIKEAYMKLIRNDKLYPGGQAIIDSILNPQLRELIQLRKSDIQLYNTKAASIMNVLVYELRLKESLSEFFVYFRRKQGIKEPLVYALYINAIDLVISNNQHIPLYDKQNNELAASNDEQDFAGIRIGGTLSRPSKSNLVTDMIVNPDKPLQYHISFSLYVDSVAHFKTIVLQTIPVLCLSIGSILVIGMLFFITFRKWQSQKQLSEMKSDFINNITHEFNTPLAAIMIANKSLRNDKLIKNPNQVALSSEIIERQTNRLKQLVDQVLDVVSFSRFTLHCEQRSLHTALSEIITDFKARFDNEIIQIRYNPGAGNDCILFDQFYLTTLVINILDNAVKYNESSVKWINISTDDNEQCVCLRINDNGQGMSAETQKNMFMKFYRNIETCRDTRPKGIGLGLYYVYRIAKAHGWKIKVESELGEGTMFVLIIPKPVN